jgi:hypothetical protein
MQDGYLIEVNVNVTEYLVCVTYNKDCMEKLSYLRQLVHHQEKQWTLHHC